MRALGFESKRSDMEKLLSEIDDDSSVVTEKMFIAMMAQKRAERDPHEEMMKKFNLFDESGEGKIGKD